MIGEGGQSRPTGIRRLWASGTAMSGAKFRSLIRLIQTSYFMMAMRSRRWHLNAGPPSAIDISSADYSKNRGKISRLRAFLSQIFLHSNAPMLADTVRGFRTVYNFCALTAYNQLVLFLFCIAMFCPVFIIIFCFPCKQGLSENFVISQLGRTLLNRIFGPGFLVNIMLRKTEKRIKSGMTQA